MTTTLDSLLKICEAATPGPWETEGGMNLYVFTKSQCMISQARGDGCGFSDLQQGLNSKHIAAFNPKTASALIRALQKARDSLWDYSAKSAVEEIDKILKEAGIEG